MANQVVTLDLKKAKLTETWKVPRSRKTNDELRGKRHLTPAEIRTVCKTLRQRSRHKDRDECMVLVAFHHGLRVSELTNIKWQHIDLKAGQIAIKRLKNGIDTVHPISDARELMLLKRLHQAQDKPKTGFVFRNERGGAVSTNGFQKLFAAASEHALGVKWNAHALRHACGTALVDKGLDLRTVQVYMGHRNIQNTTQYTHETVRQFDKIEW
jgi:type 1 fimbriae regulatory protein FimB/type 1 fimbriae regulatory protein FimE